MMAMDVDPIPFAAGFLCGLALICAGAYLYGYLEEMRAERKRKR